MHDFSITTRRRSCSRLNEFLTPLYTVCLFSAFMAYEKINPAHLCCWQKLAMCQLYCIFFGFFIKYQTSLKSCAFFPFPLFRLSTTTLLGWRIVGVGIWHFSLTFRGKVCSRRRRFLSISSFKALSQSSTGFYNVRVCVFLVIIVVCRSMLKP